MKSRIAITLLIMVGAGLILFLMGRIPFCKCGEIRIWSSDVTSNQQSQQLTDPYSFTHIIHGALLYALLWIAFGDRLPVGTRFLLAVGFECGWEILENTNFVINRYRAATISHDYYGDSIFNSFGDVLSMMGGFFLAWKLPPRVSIVMMLALDTALLFAIHDSLALNIVMLIYPVEAIKHWQIH